MFGLDLRGAGRALRSPSYRWFLWGRVAGAPTADQVGTLVQREIILDMG